MKEAVWFVQVSFGPGATFRTLYEGTKEEAEEAAEDFIAEQVERTGRVMFVKYQVQEVPEDQIVAVDGQLKLKCAPGETEMTAGEIDPEQLAAAQARIARA